MLKLITTNQTESAALRMILYTRCPAAPAPRTVRESKHLGRIERDILDTASHHYGRALGLSANQIGHHIRAFAFRNPKGGQFIVVFNPELIGTTGGVKALHEACLSRVDEDGELLPGIRVRRPKQTRVRVDRLVGGSFITETLTLKGAQARVFLHELEHLNGREI